MGKNCGGKQKSAALRVILNRVLRGEECGFHLDTYSMREDSTDQIPQSQNSFRNDWKMQGYVFEVRFARCL
jgi:hypothetical protein